MTEIRQRKAWCESVLRQLRKGVPLTEALALSRVGISYFKQEVHRNPDFGREVDEIRDHREVRSRSLS